MNKPILDEKLFKDIIKRCDERKQFFDKAIALEKFKKNFQLSEREASRILEISKTEVHRLLQLAKLAKTNKDLYRASKEHVIQKWVFVDYLAIKSPKHKSVIKWFITNGLARSRKQLKNIVEKIGNDTGSKKLRVS